MTINPSELAFLLNILPPILILAVLSAINFLEPVKYILRYPLVSSFAFAMLIENVLTRYSLYDLENAL